MIDDWFRALTGFAERSYEETRRQLEVRDGRLHTGVGSRSYAVGQLATPSLAELRAAVAGVGRRSGGASPLGVSVVQGDAGQLHRDPANRGALFQVASQFNLLEMTGPTVTPEDGVTRYAYDRTQGPACAIAAGAATIYRNYFAPVDGQAGQTSTRQIDCLRDLGAALGNKSQALWTMENGYALCTASGLAEIERRIADASETERDALRGLLRVGVHRDVEVTTAVDAGHLVSQVFCSALPVRYTDIPRRRWAAFATLVLEAAYEATIWAAVLNASRGGSPVVFLTELGGGAFGNDRVWIHAAIRRAFRLARGCDLDVRLVSYGAPDEALKQLVARASGPG